MTVASETNKSGPYAGAGTTGPFTVGFRFLDETHLRVIKTSTTGIDSDLTLTTDYTVAGVGNDTGSVTLVTALASGEKLTIVRDVPFVQETDYQNNDAFPAESHENALDLLTMQTQQLKERVDAALTLPATTSGVSTELPTPEASKLIGWDSVASGLQNYDTQTLATIVAFGTANADLFDGDGSTTQFTLSDNPGALNNLDVSIGGVTQTPGLDYTWTSGTTITFTSAPPVGTDNVLVRYLQGLPQGTTDSAASTYLPAGTGAVASNVQSKLREYVSVKDFGAVGDGVTNDTAAINAALTHASTSKLQVRFPAGTYLYDGGGVLGAGVVVVGDGRNSTTIRSRLASPTSGFLFNASGYGAGVRGMYFDAAVTQTSGSYVWLTGPESFLDDFHITNDYNGVLMTGNVARIRHGRFQDGASGAIRIRAEGGDNSQLIDDVLMGAQSPQVSTAGIRVRNSSALIISNTSIIQQGHCLLVDPYSNTPSSTDSGSVFSLFVNNCFFDNAGGNAIRIAPTGNASVVRCRFANVWANSAVTDNVYINNAGTGIVQGMHFESCHALLSPGSGFSLTGTLSDIVINGGEICQNAFGVYVNNAVTNLRVTNATIGSGAGLSGNTGYGIQFAAGAAASNQIVIANNTMVGNGAGAIDVSAVTGTSVSVYGNFGDNARSFTPTISFATPGNLAVTYAAQFGTFRRVGDMVIATFTVATSAFTHTTASGVLVIGGLPYVAAAGSEGALEVQGITKAGYSQFTLNLSAGASSMNVRGSGSGVAIANVTAADMPSGGSVTLRGTIMYLV